MKNKQQAIEQELKELKAKLQTLEESGGDSRKALKELAELNERRNKLESKYLELVIENEENSHTDAWDGTKQSILQSIKGLEKNLKRSIKNSKKSGPSKLEIFTNKVTQNPYYSWGMTLVMVYLLLVAVSCLGSGFSWLFGGQQGAQELFSFATNPFMGLIIGLLSTAIIQSSSTTTSIIVAMCAAGMPVTAAIPMVMGANIGTTITNTLVSLGHIGRKSEFKKAFAAATVHDFFNMLAVMIFLPLEMMTHFLERSAGWLSGLFYGNNLSSANSFNVLNPLLKPADHFFSSIFQMLPFADKVNASLFIAFGIFLIFAAILLLGKILRVMMTGRAEKIFHTAVGRSPINAIASGLGITMLVQSSSTTTSLIVPLAGAGIMTLEQVYPFTLGANIGTCITAMIAATAISGTGAQAALQIAFVHLLFNTYGVALIYGVFFLRAIPMFCARTLAKIASEHKSLAFVYIVGVFFLLPCLCLFVYKAITPAPKATMTIRQCPNCGATLPADLCK